MYVHGPWGMAEDDDGSWSAYAIVDRSPMRIRKGLASFKEGAVFIRDSRDGNRMEGDCMEKGTGGTEDVEGVKEHHYTDDKGLQSITEVGGVERIDKAVTGDKKDDPRIKAQKEGNPGHQKVPIAPGSKDVVDAYVHNMGDKNPADYEVDITEVIDRPEDTLADKLVRQEEQREFNEKVKAKKLADAQKLAEQEADATPSMTPAQMAESDRAKTIASKAYGGTIDGNHMIYDFQTGEAQGETLTDEDIGFTPAKVGPKTQMVRDALALEAEGVSDEGETHEERMARLNAASDKAKMDRNAQQKDAEARAQRKADKEARKQARKDANRAERDRAKASTEGAHGGMQDALSSVYEHYSDDSPENVGKSQHFMKSARELYAEKMGLKMTGARPLNPATADMPSLRDGSVHQAGFRTTVIGYGHDTISRDPRNAQVSSSGMRVRRL